MKLEGGCTWKKQVLFLLEHPVFSGGTLPFSQRFKCQPCSFCKFHYPPAWWDPHHFGALEELRIQATAEQLKNQGLCSLFAFVCLLLFIWRMKDNQLYHLQLLSCQARFFSLKSFTSFKVLPTISFTYSEVTMCQARQICMWYINRNCFYSEKKIYVNKAGKNTPKSLPSWNAWIFIPFIFQ